MINFNDFYQIISKNRLYNWLETLPAQIAVWQKCLHKKQCRKWSNTLKVLPIIYPYKLDLRYSITAQSKQPLNIGQNVCIEKLMRILMPWRKGPFLLYGLSIDSEWRSDMKWKRIFPHLSDLTGRIILDVGCGNGYYLWRMIGANAHLAVGIDPIHLFFFQFEAIRKLLGNIQKAYLMPISIEQLPSLSAFDTVFSMGVLYHCRSPLEHLWKLKAQLVHGGELVLETLIIKGDENTVMVPSDRYAQMRNVYFIPSALALKNWLKKCGFINIRIVDTCITTTKEQRSTMWMNRKSLENFLDPQNNSKTIEGYAAPLRAVLIASKP